MAIKNNHYFFKFNKTKGIVYVQIWKMTVSGSVYIRTCGSAEALNKKLVLLQELQNQTN
jgi:hypothetical protein